MFKSYSNYVLISQFKKRKTNYMMPFKTHSATDNNVGHLVKDRGKLKVNTMTF